MGRLRPTGSGHWAFQAQRRPWKRSDLWRLVVADANNDETQRLPKVNSPKSPPAGPTLLPLAPFRLRRSLAKNTMFSRSDWVSGQLVEANKTLYFLDRVGFRVKKNHRVFSIGLGFRPRWGPNMSQLRPTSGQLERTWANLRPTWANLRPTWVQLGPPEP